ncbi:hypothetical protein E6B08_07270 [Pseudomonas putida]|uniref:Uncharacterized protein n=1 Tax=Pseudomonas putida TaxID=303 RepID=A0A4D6X9L5_PSEPU|nr:hypothetical protein E6B08_07270 [Pseudomonas putida]
MCIGRAGLFAGKPAPTGASPGQPPVGAGLPAKRPAQTSTWHTLCFNPDTTKPIGQRRPTRAHTP